MRMPPGFSFHRTDWWSELLHSFPLVHQEPQASQLVLSTPILLPCAYLLLFTPRTYFTVNWLKCIVFIVSWLSVPAFSSKLSSYVPLIVHGWQLWKSKCVWESCLEENIDNQAGFRIASSEFLKYNALNGSTRRAHVSLPTRESFCSRTGHPH